MTTESALQTARTQLRRAVELLQLTENDWQTLSTPRRILEVRGEGTALLLEHLHQVVLVHIGAVN